MIRLLFPILCLAFIVTACKKPTTQENAPSTGAPTACQIEDLSGYYKQEFNTKNQVTKINFYDSTGTKFDNYYWVVNYANDQVSNVITYGEMFENFSSYSYNSQKLVSEITKYNNTTGVGLPRNKLKYYYDSEGNLLAVSSFDYDQLTGKYSFSDSSAYFNYVNKRPKDEITYRNDFASNSKVIDKKYRMVYDGNNNMILKTVANGKDGTYKRDEEHSYDLTIKSPFEDRLLSGDGNPNPGNFDININMVLSEKFYSSTYKGREQPEPIVSYSSEYQILGKNTSNYPTKVSIKSTNIDEPTEVSEIILKYRCN